MLLEFLAMIIATKRGGLFRSKIFIACYGMINIPTFLGVREAVV